MEITAADLIQIEGYAVAACNFTQEFCQAQFWTGRRFGDDGYAVSVEDARKRIGEWRETILAFRRTLTPEQTWALCLFIEVANCTRNSETILNQFPDFDEYRIAWEPLSAHRRACAAIDRIDSFLEWLTTNSADEEHIDIRSEIGNEAERVPYDEYRRLDIRIRYENRVSLRYLIEHPEAARLLAGAASLSETPPSRGYDSLFHDVLATLSERQRDVIKKVWPHPPDVCRGASYDELAKCWTEPPTDEAIDKLVRRLMENISKQKFASRLRLNCQKRRLTLTVIPQAVDTKSRRQHAPPHHG